MKALIFTAFCGLTILPLDAQHGMDEFHAGYGMFTSVRKLSELSRSGASHPWAAADDAGYRYPGSFQIGYKHYDMVTQHIPVALCVTLAYEQALSGSITEHYLSLVGGLNLIYFHRPKLMIYGVMAVGATYSRCIFHTESMQVEDRRSIHLNFQLTPFGIRYGRRIGVYAEFGLGCKGYISSGVFVSM